MHPTRPLHPSLQHSLNVLKKVQQQLQMQPHSTLRDESLCEQLQGVMEHLLEHSPVRPRPALEAAMHSNPWQPAPKEAGQPDRPHWQLQEGGVEIPICFDSQSPAQTHQYLRAVRQWNDVLSGVLELRYSTFKGSYCNPNKGFKGIVITWKKSPTLERPNDLGHCDCHVETIATKAHITHAHIQLVQHPLIDEQLSHEQQQQRLFATLLHEIGHALGLQHLDHPNSVMYYRGWRSTVLSVADKQALGQLYHAGL